MRSFLGLLAGSALTLLGTAQGSIDFNPTSAERTLEGSVFHQLVFHENGRSIAYEPPAGWNYSGDHNTIVFTPANFPMARARIEQTDLPAPQPIDATMSEALKAQALALVPPGAQKVAFVSEEQSPIRIAGQPTYEAVIGYELYAQEYRFGVLFANVGKTQLRFRVLARKENFDKVHLPFRGSLCSLQWL